VDEGTIDLLLNWGAIVFIPVLPYVSWLQTRPNGLLIAFWQVRFSVRVRWCVCVCGTWPDEKSPPQGNVLVFLATVIRTIPCWAPAHLRGNFYMQWTLHVGTLSVPITS
jgi:hypothetical protein